MIRPPALKAGDTIGIVSPAAPVAAMAPRRLARGMAELERRGFRVRLGEHATARTRHTAGTVEQRLADLHGFFADPDVRGIVAAVGGHNSHQLLERLDFDLIARNPKVFSGYSDITALHGAIHAVTGLVTFYGPALLTDWAEFGGMPEYTWEQWRRVTMRAEPAGEIDPSPVWLAEWPRWDETDDRPRAAAPSPGPRTVRSGAAEGPLVAGHGSTMLLLAGTPWWPPFDGAVLCLEFAEEDGPGTVDRAFTHFRHLGVLERAAAIAIGRMHPETGIDDATVDEIALRATRGYETPIAAGFDFGHTEPHCTLPWGVRARLDADAPGIALLEAAVS